MSADRCAILPIRLTRDPLTAARMLTEASTLADAARARRDVASASRLTLTVLAIAAGELTPVSAVPL